MGNVITAMRCHYCDREATFAPEVDGVQVGLCDAHFREQFESLSDSEMMEKLRNQLDIDGTDRD
ncbi:MULTISPECIES: DUF6757 family protein [unclassified Haladaptatus]|uniref:DUF6757 family protein n=2 Tax=unclassified Haladaptatus TaxID=2622732 RepID=UPI0012371CAF|nr:DUF6757 family protein [Haladaptatus sp. R4]